MGAALVAFERDVMKLGVLLPTFRDGAEDALAFAKRAADAGLDGVFAYDHLWPMGTPSVPRWRPSRCSRPWPAATRRLVVGPSSRELASSARAHLVEQFQTLARARAGRASSRRWASGDKLSAAENAAYDIPARAPTSVAR